MTSLIHRLNIIKKKWYLTFSLEIDKEVVNIMLVIRYAPNRAN